MKKHIKDHYCKACYAEGYKDGALDVPSLATIWVDTTKKMPDENGRYLVIEDHHYKWIGIGSMRDGKFDMKITHWMPLPEPPK